MGLQELETALRALLKGKHSSLALSFNDETAPNYETVAEGIDHDMFRVTDWVSDEEKQRAIETNSVWTLHWYPDTPVGFHALSASSLEAVINAALSQK